MLGLLFTLWGLGLGTVALIGLVAVLVLAGNWRLAELAGAALVVLLVSGYLYRSGEAECQARTDAAVASAKAQIEAIADKALADAQARGTQDDAALAALQQKVATYEAALGSDNSCLATGTDADHFNQLLSPR